MEQARITPDGTVSLRGGTAEALSTENPYVARREIVVEVDTGKIKIGNGTNQYNSLPYSGGAAETWTFEMEDGTTVTKQVCAWT